MKPKQILCASPAAVMLTGFTAVPAAADEKTDEPFVYLRGVAPDVYLSTNKIFDRDYIVTLLDASF